MKKIIGIIFGLILGLGAFMIVKLVFTVGSVFLLSYLGLLGERTHLTLEAVSVLPAALAFGIVLGKIYKMSK